MKKKIGSTHTHHDKPSAFEAVNYYLEQAFDFLGYDSSLRELLKTPWREIYVQVPVRKDNGELELFKAFRVQHNGARGPYKGGTRYHPTTDLDDVRALASIMSWKTALVNIPFGGAKGGICCDPSKLSARELQTLTRSYINNIDRVIGPDRDIPAPDVGTNAQVMAWMMDEYSITNGHAPAVVTGKPVVLGGTQGREGATGRGVSLVAEFVAEDLKRPLSKMTCAIQGFGNVGSHTASYLHKRKTKIIAISDHRGGIYSAKGLPIPKILSFIEKGRPLQEFPGVKKISNNELLALKCDILIPAALGGVFDARTAREVKAKIILEAANLPTLPDGDKVFQDRGILVIPDILANAGGVIVSYFEWVQNLQQYHWEKEQINNELEKQMAAAYRHMKNFSKKHNLSYRIAAFVLGVCRVAEAEGLRGT